MAIGRSLFTVCLFLVPGICFAQIFYPPFEVSYSNNLTLLRVEEIQKELQIDAVQNAKMKEAFAPLIKRYDERLKGLGDLPKDESFKKYAEHRQAVMQEGLRLAESQLKPEQFKRFQQLCLQLRREEAFSDQEVQKALKITAEQKRQVQATLDDRDKKLKGLKSFTGADIDKLADEATQAIVAKFTPEQKKAWDDLAGPPFKFNRFGMLLRLK